MKILRKEKDLLKNSYAFEARIGALVEGTETGWRKPSYELTISLTTSYASSKVCLANFQFLFGTAKWITDESLSEERIKILALTQLSLRRYAPCHSSGASAECDLVWGYHESTIWSEAVVDRESVGFLSAVSPLKLANAGWALLNDADIESDGKI